MSLRNKFNLSVEVSTSKVHRKYLGDPSDPHFVPDSPLISRKHFTAQEEAELKRVCTLLLANVPHSDDMVDDPFRYLASYVTVNSNSKSKGGSNAKDDGKVTATQRQAVDAAGDLATFDPQAVLSDTTTTPSEASGRYSADTNSTTPMSTPGRLPEEEAKHLSASGRRPCTAHPSGLRTQLQSKGTNSDYSLTRQQQHTVPRFSASAPAAKSMTHLPSTSGVKSYQTYVANIPEIPKNPISQPNFNKSLPALPKVPSLPLPTEPRPKADRLGGLSRMLKTVRRPQTKPVANDDTRDLSVDIPPQLLDLEYDTSRKSKFEFFSFFSRRKTYSAKRATVP